MASCPPDRSRDRRIEDPTNLWLIHPAARRLVPGFVARGVSANAVSLVGLSLGMLAALSYAQWRAWPWAVAGLLLSIAWLIADGLDGMIARATGTASPLGRTLDGLCDHGVFILIYVALALSLGTAAGWALACAAGAAHVVQSSLYEAERARFHRRLALQPPLPPAGVGPLAWLYDRFTAAFDRPRLAFDDALSRHDDPHRLADAYAAAATRPMRLLGLLSANVRVAAIFVACLIGDPALFWWFELVPLTAVLLAGLAWHRAVERRLAHDPLPNSHPYSAKRI